MTIKYLRKMVINSTEEVWAFTEMENEIYSAQITMEDGYILLRSLSKRKPPENTVKIPYQEIKNLINSNIITTFLEISLRKIDDSYGKMFIHIQLQGDEGRTKQFEVMCTGEHGGVSYAKTTFQEALIENFNSLYTSILVGARNDSCDNALRDITVGAKISKSIFPGLVASYYAYEDENNYDDDNPMRKLTTRFVISTEGNTNTTEDSYIGKVVYGLNHINTLHLQARMNEAKLIDIDDCGIVLAKKELKSIPSHMTMENLKVMVTQSTSEVWAVLKRNDQEYSAQITVDKGYLLLKALSKTTPPENTITIPYRNVKSLVNRKDITVFLEIKFDEEDNLNIGNKFIHIQINGNEGLHLQFEVMCTGEIDGISYAKTVFLQTDTEDDTWNGIMGGDRNDGLDTELPGFTSGKEKTYNVYPGVVCSFWEQRKPSNFMIYTDYSDFQEIYALGKVVIGLEDVQAAYSIARKKGAGYIQIDGCGIVID